MQTAISGSSSNAVELDFGSNNLASDSVDLALYLQTAIHWPEGLMENIEGVASRVHSYAPGGGRPGRLLWTFVGLIADLPYLLTIVSAGRSAIRQSPFPKYIQYRNDLSISHRWTLDPTLAYWLEKVHNQNTYSLSKRLSAHMREPRPSGLRPHTPSPLAQVHHLRPISTGPENNMAASGGLVRDPNFWKRFSTAVHIAEDVERAPKSATSSMGSGYGDNWLLQQNQEKRRCRCIGWSVTMAVILAITAAAVVGWYFTSVKKS